MMPPMAWLRAVLGLIIGADDTVQPHDPKVRIDAHLGKDGHRGSTKLAHGSGLTSSPCWTALGSLLPE
jgi:hypothetical protein